MLFEVQTKYPIVKAKYFVMHDKIICVAFCMYSIDVLIKLA